MKLCFPELSEVSACGGSEMQPRSATLSEIVRYAAHSEMQPRSATLREIVRFAHSENHKEKSFSRGPSQTVVRLQAKAAA